MFFIFLKTDGLRFPQMSSVIRFPRSFPDISQLGLQNSKKRGIFSFTLGNQRYDPAAPFRKSGIMSQLSSVGRATDL